MIKSFLHKIPSLLTFGPAGNTAPAHLQNTPVKKARKKASKASLVSVTKEVVVASERIATATILLDTLQK